MPDRPNILFITTDTLRCDAVGCYGNQQLKTPHIDRLAREGTTYEHHYSVCPLCMPARNSWLTGLYPHQHRCVGNLTGPISEELRPLTFPSLLQQAGYVSHYVGKHHFFDFWQQNRDLRDVHDELLGFGFDSMVQVVDVFENLHNLCDFTHDLEDRGLLEAYRADVASGGLKPITAVEPSDTVDGFVGRVSLERLRELGDDQPFFLWASFPGPHPPYRAPGEYGERHKWTDMPSPRYESDPKKIAHTQQAYAQYYGMIEYLDEWVGELVGELSRQGRLDDTIVAFTSDHGDMFGERGIHDKRHFWEPCVTIPLVIRGPGYRAGWRSKVLSESVDLPVTFLTAGGTSKPALLPPRPGLDLVALEDATTDVRRDAVFSQMGTGLMIRTARWKFVYDAEQGGPMYLYDLVDDPLEAVNLSGKAGYEAKEAELTARLLTWLTCSTTYTQDKERQRVKRVMV